MKKQLLTLSLLLLGALVTTAYGQFSIGARAGANLANVAITTDGEDSDTDARFGFAAGLVAEIGISEMFAVQPEVLFSQHGAVETTDFLGEEIETKIRHNYVQVPVLAKLTFGSEALGINVLAGPHIGLGMGDIMLETTAGGMTEEDSGSWEDAGLTTFDFGITGGVGVSFPAGPGKLGIDARYQLGLVNFFEDGDDDNSIYNRNIQFGLSYLFPLGGN